jgi:hypothetical protein
MQACASFFRPFPDKANEAFMHRNKGTSKKKNALKGGK